MNLFDKKTNEKNLFQNFLYKRRGKGYFMKLLKILTLFILLIVAITVSAIGIDINDILINVSVVGAVDNPGIYKLPMGSKLSEAVKMANLSSSSKLPTASIPQVSMPSQISDNSFFSKDKKDEKQAVEGENTVSLRNITIKRGKEKINIDLKQFLALGDNANNPELKDGDIIIIPAAQDFVYLYGEINSIGKYEIKQGDKLNEIFKLALGLKNSAYLDKIEIIRYKQDHKTYQKIMINYNEVSSNLDSTQNITLKDGDRVYVRSIPDFQKEFTVSIQGNAKFPGDYSIRENATTLLEILTKAGGPNEFSNISQATLIRNSLKENDNNMDFDSDFTRLSSLSVTEMTDEEYSYYKSKYRLINGFVDVDFKKLWDTKDKKFDVTLKNGDIIYIPSAKLTVEILGQVKNPGKYTYVSGKSYDYYLAQANGFALRPNKRKIRIIKFKTGTWEKAKDAVIDPGDKIFIPEKPEYNYLNITKDVIQILSGAATMYLLFIK